MRWLQPVPSTFLTKHATFSSLVVGVNLLTNPPHQAVNFLFFAGNRPLDFDRNAPVAAAADRGFSPAWGLQHHRLTPIHRIVRTRGSEAADPASRRLLVADPATPLLVALGLPSKPLIVLLDHAERGVGRRGVRCVGRCGGVSLSKRPQRGSTEKEPEEPGRTKNKQRTRKEKPVLFGRYPV